MYKTRKPYRGGIKDVEARLPKFSSEILLQQAIAGLLARMPGISGVQIIHGAQELGKDVIFQTSGPFGEMITCACVIKNHKISGNVTDRSSARAIFNQIEQALDSPFLDGSGEATRVHRVYVMSPEEISQSTMHSIAGKLSSRSGQVLFIGGTQLFQLFKSYWIDFFSDEYASMESYLERLSRVASTSALHSASDIYNLGAMTETEAAIYVNRSLFREANIFTVIDLSSYMAHYWSSTFWYKSDIDSFISTAGSIANQIEYLANWGFFHETSVARALREFASELGRAWSKSANSRMKAQSSLNLSINTIKVRINDEAKGRYRSLTRSMASGIQSLRDACEVTRRLPEKSCNISLLADPDWQLASALSDCVRYAPMNIWESKSGTRLELTDLDLLEYPGHMLVVGAAGYGKTSFCRWHALADAERFRTGSSTILPVFIPLNAISSLPLDDFEESFLQGIGRSALFNDMALRRATKVRLYLDGLDEVAFEPQRKKIIDLIKMGPSKRKLDFQSIVTSRDYIVGRWLSGIPRLELQQLTREQIEDLKEQWFRGAPHLRTALEEQLGNLPSLDTLLKVPLLATLIVMVFRQTGSLPESQTRLYSIFIDLLSGGWDLSKNVLRQSHFGRIPKTLVLTYLAALVQSMRVKYFTAAEVYVAAERIMHGDERVIEAMREELIIDGVLTQSGNQFYFSHLSFQEFLAAKHFLGDPKSKEITRVLRMYIAGDDWWREVIRFYIGLSENPANITAWLISELEKFKDATPVAYDLFTSVKEFFPDCNLRSYVRQSARHSWVKDLEILE